MNLIWDAGDVMPLETQGFVVILSSACLRTPLMGWVCISCQKSSSRRQLKLCSLCNTTPYDLPFWWPHMLIQLLSPLVLFLFYWTWMVVNTCFFSRCHSHVVLTWPHLKVSDLDLAVSMWCSVLWASVSSGMLGQLQTDTTAARIPRDCRGSDPNKAIYIIYYHLESL